MKIDMDTILIIFYVIGVIISFIILDKKYQEFEKENKDRYVSKEEKQQEDSIIIIMSIFSWLTLLLLFFNRKK